MKNITTQVNSMASLPRRRCVALLVAPVLCAPLVAASWAQAQIPPDAPSAPPSGAGPATPVGPIAVPPSAGLSQAPTSRAAARRTELPTVTIREFRSSVAEVTPRGATDMFITALVRTRKFRVVERARLAEGAGAEKAINQQGLTTGQAGQSQYLGATYLFEATVSEASAGERTGGLSLGVAGATASRATASDSIAIDVRVTDVESGVVVDAVSVRKQLKATLDKVSGITGALANIFARGRTRELAQAAAPSDEVTSARKDSLDAALREAMDEAVKEIAKRLHVDD